MTFVEVWWLYPEEYMNYSDSKQQILLGIGYSFGMCRGTQYIKGGKKIL